MPQMIQDLISYWERKLENAKPEELPELLRNLMKERVQFDPDTQKAMVDLNTKYAPKA